MKSFLERTTFLGALARRRRLRRFKKKYAEWQAQGSILPLPHWGKQKIVSEYAHTFGLQVFVETGTYHGAMVYSVLNNFEKILSIELDDHLFQRACKRFEGYEHVHIFQGESEKVLPEVLGQIDRPALFWLDAHWSGGDTARGPTETPVLEEVNCILSHPCVRDHVLLIDDARCFTGENDYPEMSVFRDFLLSAQPEWVFEVREDIIRFHPPVK